MELSSFSRKRTATGMLPFAPLPVDLTPWLAGTPPHRHFYPEWRPTTVIPTPALGSAMPSSVIRKFSYIAEENALDITFVSGKRYRYLGVPEVLYQQMRHAFSKGEFFNEHIRDHFAFERMHSIS
jgi:hypothetical protein